MSPRFVPLRRFRLCHQSKSSVGQQRDMWSYLALKPDLIFPPQTNWRLAKWRTCPGALINSSSLPFWGNTALVETRRLRSGMRTVVGRCAIQIRVTELRDTLGDDRLGHIVVADCLAFARQTTGGAALPTRARRNDPTLDSAAGEGRRRLGDEVCMPIGGADVVRDPGLRAAYQALLVFASAVDNSRCSRTGAGEPFAVLEHDADMAAQPNSVFSRWRRSGPPVILNCVSEP